jgi:alkanesulfonate monooxygenase SsuD/methylene tetrahydromethanopterin reductase-like flavin-dependent oxidoreductase (luciferase family)
MAAGVTPEMREAMSRQRRQEQGRAQTIEELIALGHHPKAAEKIVEARAAKQDLISALIADMTAWAERTNQYPLPVFGVSFRDIRYMKPKALKELRARFEAHQAAYLAGDLDARKIQPELL